MPDFAHWPTPADVLNRLAGAGIDLRSGDTAPVQAVLDGLADEVAAETHVQFVADTGDTARLYDGSGAPEMEVDPMVSLTGVMLLSGAEPGVPLSGVGLALEIFRPRTRLITGCGGLPGALFPAGRQNVRVTGRFGYGATIPRDIWAAAQAEAALRLAQEALFGAAGQVTAWIDKDAELRFAPGGAAAIGWHALYRDALARYRRPAGHRLRGLKARMQ